MRVDVRQADPEDLGALAALFDGYRIFYRQESDLRGAEQFMGDRLRLRDSTLFIACHDDSKAVGFVQLYPSFSSVSMRRVFILNDLFVAPEARRAGVGQALMHAAERHARSEGAVRITLSTAIDNVSAQQLYQANGFSRDESFYQYHRYL